NSGTGGAGGQQGLQGGQPGAVNSHVVKHAAVDKAGKDGRLIGIVDFGDDGRIAVLQRDVVGHAGGGVVNADTADLAEIGHGADLPAHLADIRSIGLHGGDDDLRVAVVHRE